ncbi:MAG: hypothetical protein IJO29_05195 [Oscillospiraceae bacterium]|nr:hypothetical protein [Oscillospiraceae bacterium]
MKRVLALATAAMLAFSVSCSKIINQKNEAAVINSQSQVDSENLEIIRYDTASDRFICSNLKDFKQYCDALIVGTIIETQDVIVIYEPYSTSRISMVATLYSVRVDKVLEGELKDGQQITLCQNSGPHNGAICAFSSLNPLKDGQQRIMGISESYGDRFEGSYCLSGDYTSCFPLPSDALYEAVNNGDTAEQNRIVSEMSTSDFGVYDDIVPPVNLYLDLLNEYDFSLE